mgnify:CR=1 FL=1
MTKLSENFSLHEFECRDGSQVPDEYMDNVKKLVKNLQIIRDEIGCPITIISGYRSLEYNTKIKGAKRSQHMFARAGDLVAANLSSFELWEVIKRLIKEKKIDSGGVGLYTTFVHYDVRGWNSRWYGTGAKAALKEYQASKQE